VTEIFEQSHLYYEKPNMLTITSSVWLVIDVHEQALDMLDF